MGRSKNNYNLVLVGLMLSCWVANCRNALSSSKCKLRRYTHNAVQIDFNGLRCWDEVEIMSCWGYCLSHETADWQFPYKVSYHPVCLHGDRKHASVKLRNCDPGVEPGTDVYHYVEAAYCKCQVCSSEDTSCEWLPPDYFLLDQSIKEELEDME
ncbi:thyrostimulin beta-5 subunit isoform X1 [Melitaea cinxia]|uniref:thyrostimulin beta-5 subunit isoform X1 n=2 Tax=Melitaea cinxia TaxID=113334 RepID=UPI001E2700F7|nr:thyrostimulin beta-5 subunit isoform X1 [Melitaea cinxia]